MQSGDFLSCWIRAYFEGEDVEPFKENGPNIIVGERCDYELYSLIPAAVHWQRPHYCNVLSSESYHSKVGCKAAERSGKVCIVLVH